VCGDAVAFFVFGGFDGRRSSRCGFAFTPAFGRAEPTHRKSAMNGAPGRGLLFVDEAGAAGLVYLEVDVDFDTVGDLDEGMLPLMP
jgi:hypothetical protein